MKTLKRISLENFEKLSTAEEAQTVGGCDCYDEGGKWFGYYQYNGNGTYSGTFGCTYHGFTGTASYNGNNNSYGGSLSYNYNGMSVGGSYNGGNNSWSNSAGYSNNGFGGTVSYNWTNGSYGGTMYYNYNGFKVEVKYDKNNGYGFSVGYKYSF